jgi:ubiquinol-cytochrome c reductase cytochrome c1 subunit
MMWAAEPHLVERKEIGFKVLVFLAIFAMLLYFARQQVWADIKRKPTAT